MIYNKFSYIYPPRPKNAVPTKDIPRWDNGMMVSQPKMNGSNCLIFTNGDQLYTMNRHGQSLTNFQIKKEEIFDNLYSGTGWMVINGEYLNKAKKDENGKLFNHKLAIFDILVYNSNYLVGTTFQDRIDLLDKLYGNVDCDKKYLTSISESIFKVKSYQNDLLSIYNDLSKIDIIEGIVCKRKNAKLELGTTENNNTRSMIKFRKPTKNYKF